MGLRKNGFHGLDIKHLFQSLDLEGRGQILPSDFFFLDEWNLAEILDADAQDLLDFAHSECSSNSDGVDAEHTEEEEKEHCETNVDAKKQMGSLPQRPMPLQTWPRITLLEPPNPKGKRSRLYSGCGEDSQRQAINGRVSTATKRGRPLHIEIMAALRSARTNNNESKAAMYGTPGARRYPSVPSEDSASSLLYAIGWKETDRHTPDLHPSVHATTPDFLCTSPPRCHSALGRSRGSPQCRSALGRSRESPRCRSALGSSRPSSGAVVHNAWTD